MRLIDADALFDFLTEQLDKETGMYSKGRNVGINIARSALHDKTTTPTITPPPNAPLTLEELREMGGEPVWIHSFSSVQKKTRISGWAIMETTGDANATFVRAGVNSRTKKWFANYGCTWLAYRRKPEEPTP